MSWLSEGWDALTGKSGRKSAEKMNQENIALQRETNAQNERIMREQWAREDTAMQRRVSDLESSGLSRIMAQNVGGAPAGGLSHMEAPKKTYDEGRGYISLPDMIQTMANGVGIYKTLVDAMKTRAEAGKVQTETDIARYNAWMDDKEKRAYPDPQAYHDTGKTEYRTMTNREYVRELELYGKRSKKQREGWEEDTSREKSKIAQYDRYNKQRDLQISEQEKIRSFDDLNARIKRQEIGSSARLMETQSAMLQKKMGLLIPDMIIRGVSTALGAGFAAKGIKGLMRGPKSKLNPKDFVK